MGIFSALRGAPYDSLVELATSEANTSINWSQISSLCEAVNEDPKGAKSCFGSILRRLRSPIPIVQMQCLQLIDSAIHDCGKPFHLQVCSRDFVNVLLRLAGSKVHAKVSERARLLIRAWADQFRADPQLSLMCSLYEKLKSEGAYLLLNPKKEVKPRNELKHPSGYGKAVDTKQEETINLQDALLEEHQVMKAIELSLGEQHAKQQAAQGAKDTLVGVPLTSQASSLYPTLTNEKSAKPSTEPLKVRALYDFEAAEVNELTFKAGELLLVSDSSNVNWWSGSNHRGQGLFPASFVTTDLAAKHEQSVQVKETSKKKVHFNEQIELLREKSQDVKAGAIEPTPIEIDESRLDRLLHLLAEADPKQADSEELLDLEEKCISMLPLINASMEVTDKRNVSLSELSGQLAVALNLYHDLMKDSLLMQGQATLASSDPFGAMSLKAGGQPSESYVHPRLSGYISQPPPYCPGQMTGHFGQRAPRSAPNVAPAGQYFAPPQEQLNAGYSKLYQMPDGMSMHSHGPFSKVNHLGEPKLAYSMAGSRQSQPHEALNGPPQAHPRMMAPSGQYPQGSVSFSQSTGHTRPRNNSPFEAIYSHTDHRQQQQPSNRYLAPTPQASQQHQVGPHNYAPVYHHQGWLPVYPGAPLSVPNQPYARPRTQLIHEPGMYLNLPSASSNPHAYSAMPCSHGTNGNLTQK